MGWRKQQRRRQRRQRNGWLRQQRRFANLGLAIGESDPIESSRRKNRHHLRNKCRGGDFSPSNIALLKIWKHNQWHRVFRNSDPEYIIRVLLRLCRMKHYPISEDILEMAS